MLLIPLLGHFFYAQAGDIFDDLLVVKNQNLSLELEVCCWDVELHSENCQHNKPVVTFTTTLYITFLLWNLTRFSWHLYFHHFIDRKNPKIMHVISEFVWKIVWNFFVHSSMFEKFNLCRGVSLPHRAWPNRLQCQINQGEGCTYLLLEEQLLKFACQILAGFPQAHLYHSEMILQVWTVTCKICLCSVILCLRSADNVMPFDGSDFG